MKVGVFGYYGMGNTGDEAILGGLKEVLNRIFPSVSVITFGRGNLLPFGLRSSLKAIFSPREFKTTRALLRSCDYVIVGGGGLFTDEERPFTAMFWALQGLYATHFKKPVLCLGISVGKMSWFSRFFVKKLLKKAKLVTVRDKSSQKLLLKWGIASHETSDFSLLFPYKRREIANKKKYIVLSLRWFKKISEKTYTIFAHFCDFLVEKYGLHVRLLPFQDGVDLDADLLNKIYVQCEHKESIVLEHFHGNIPEVLSLLGNAEAVIAMRLHAGILALLAETPFFPIAYMDKVNDFWEEFPEVKCFSFEKTSLCDLKMAFDKFWMNREKIKSHLERIKNSMINKVLKMEKLLENVQDQM